MSFQKKQVEDELPTEQIRNRKLSEVRIWHQAQSVMMCDCRLRGGAEVMVGHSTSPLGCWTKTKYASKQDLGNSRQMPDPCADKNLMKIQICLMTVRTKIWEIFGNAWPGISMCGQKWLKSREPDPSPDRNWSKMFGNLYVFRGMTSDNSHLGEWFFKLASITAILNLPVQIFEHMYLTCTAVNSVPNPKDKLSTLRNSVFLLRLSSFAHCPIHQKPRMMVQTFNAHANTRRSRHLQSIEYSSLRY